MGLVELSRDFVERLQRRIANWRHATCVGDIFHRLSGNLKLYSLYVKSFGDADALLKKKLASSKEFDKAIKACQKKADTQNDLVSLLIMPVQVSLFYFVSIHPLCLIL